MSELTPRDPARRHYYRNVRNAFVAAAALHGIAFAAAPAYIPRPLRMRSEEIRVVKAAGFTAAWPMVALPVGERAPAGEATADRDGWNAGSPVRTERASARRENPPISGSGPTEEQSAGPRTEPGETRSAGSEDGPPLFYAYDAPPRVTHAITPEYPAAARSAGAEGTVIVNVNVDEHGRVTRAWVATAEAPESLIEAALDASYQFVFAAGTMRNVPVPCTVAIPFQFSLRRTFQDQ